MFVASIKSDDAIFAMHCDPIAIGIWLRRGDDRPHRESIEMTDALQSLFDLSRFNRELMLISDVLIGAATAPAEVRTFRGHSVR